MLYAEQIMMEKKCNQWFIFFHKTQPGWNHNMLTYHMDWFKSNLVTTTMVGGLGDLEAKGNLYHVDFLNDQDPRLAAYMAEWETADGISKHPSQYQMLEWNYGAWMENDGAAEFERFLSQR